MQQFNNLYGFIEFAKANRKYKESTASNLKSAVKIFEKVLTEDELADLSLVENRIEEIFTNVIGNNRDKNAASLNAYKARLLRVIGDFKKYNDPQKMQNWHVSTALLNRKDNQDKKRDNHLSDLSLPSHTPVDNMHKIELSLRDNSKAVLLIPKNITKPEADIIKSLIDSISGRYN